MELDRVGGPGPSTMAARRLPIPPKVSQIDADDLDEALVGMLGERIERSLGNLRGSVSYDLKPEISLLLKLVIFRYGVYDPLAGSSPGSKLQNLRLASTIGSRIPTKRKLLIYLLLHPPIFPSYILTRLRLYGLSNQWPDLPARDWRRRAWKVILFIESFAKFWELAGWTAFLFDPRYPSLLMRILRLRLIPSSPHMTRLVSYEFMNRQLVWTAFTEFAMFAVPRLPSLPSYLAPTTYITAAKTLISRPSPIDYTSIPLLPSSAGFTASRGAHSGPFAELPIASCPICHQRRVAAPVPLSNSETGAEINLPPIGVEGGDEEERIFVAAETDCWGGCRYCYYCIATELAKHAEEGAKLGMAQQRGQKSGETVESAAEWDCLRCGGGVTRAWRMGADVERTASTETEAEALDVQGDE